MKQKYIRAYMDVAKRFAELSSAVRLQVGAIVVKEDRIISIGYNGMPPGWSNECEYKDYYPEGNTQN
jgi:dCMP deaminase